MSHAPGRESGGTTRLPIAMLAADLTDGEFRLLAALRSLADADGVCNATDASLARRSANILPDGTPNLRRVQRLLATLEAKGFIARARRDEGDRVIRIKAT